MKKIIVNAKSREKRYAIIKDNRVVRFEIHQPGEESQAGNIYLGTVLKVIPGMDAVFVDIGSEKQGFLHRDQLPSYSLSPLPAEQKKSLPLGKFIREGEKLPVQVVREGTESKGPKLSGIIEIASENLVLMHGTDYIGVSRNMANGKLQNQWRKRAFSVKEPGEGMIIRTGLEHATEDQFLKELNELRKKWQEIQKRALQMKKPGPIYQKDSFLEKLLKEPVNAGDEIIIDDLQLFQAVKNASGDACSILYDSGNENVFSKYGAEMQVDAALNPAADAANGVSLVIEQTEACTVVDVNSGSFTGKMEKEATVLAANLAAAKEIAVQLSLRGIGGMILIDFINMKEESSRRKVEEELAAALSKDEARTKIIGFTPLGILQLTRKKTSRALREKLTVPCPVCSGSGRVESAETSAFRLERELLALRSQDEEAVWIEAEPSVIQVFAGSGREHLPYIEELAAKRIYITPLQAGIPGYIIRQLGSIDDIKSRIGGGAKSV
ncbi:Rne/Rng family ribonuclease [Peribacillus kribbensis]|uniref:Rne/Rng family ribonuclease n=1 Tax=Peribacillus kribbensis TaxID=356658 RepID=UPI0003FCAAC5|nr:Rne/Rng family ribonuclease [Peribacillus kribbensis]